MMIRFPALTVLRLKKLWPHARKQGREKGQIWRVGYYSKQDGLNCIWLVDENGNYDWTVEAGWIVDKFEIVALSNEKDRFGMRRPTIRKLSQKEKKGYLKLKPDELLRPSQCPNKKGRS